MRQDVTHVVKKWGSETWFVNNELYCGKMLVINDRFQCSLHRHISKDETFAVMEGAVWLEVGEEGLGVVLEVGDSYRIAPGTYHRFRSMGGQLAIVIEFSTQHSDEDVERLEESRAI